MPDVGVERHLRGLSDETKSALETILDIEHAPSDVVLPSMAEIDAEETESQRLKAERKALLADEQEKQRASRVSVRDRFGQPVTITSGNRCPEYNAKVGGSSKSYHPRGRAADIQVANVAPADVQAYLLAKYPDQYGIGCYDDFTHVDTRSNKARW